MIYLKDDGEDWSSVSNDLTEIVYESGKRRSLRTSDLELEAGKYKGMTLADISDVWYLNFLKKISTEKNDVFLAHCVDMRLNELY